jgi:hypothetical protein
MAALPASAQAADACLAPADFSALTAYGMPSAITGTADRCAATLPAGALRSSGKAASDRYAAARPAQWPAAKSALGKLLAITAPPEMQAADRHARSPATATGRHFRGGHGGQSCPPRAARWWTGC